MKTGTTQTEPQLSVSATPVATSAATWLPIWSAPLAFDRRDRLRSRLASISPRRPTNPSMKYRLSWPCSRGKIMSAGLARVKRRAAVPPLDCSKSDVLVFEHERNVFIAILTDRACVIASFTARRRRHRMPTLAEAWLAEQTAERPPWRHPPMSEAGAPSETPVSPLSAPAETWLRRWTP